MRCNNYVVQLGDALRASPNCWSKQCYWAFLSATASLLFLIVCLCEILVALGFALAISDALTGAAFRAKAGMLAAVNELTVITAMIKFFMVYTSFLFLAE